MTETMEERVERLRRLQMEDLGTARREYISTVDSTKLRKTRVEVIEATRRSNVPGSVEQRVAEANKSRLEGWTNVYKKLDDTGDLEHLDNLLNGQSHRLQLNQAIREIGRQSYSYPVRRNGTSMATGKIPVLHGPSTRLVSAAQPRPSRAVPKPAQPSYKPPLSRSALDPALDVNNAATQKGLRVQKRAFRPKSSKGLTSETLTVRKLTGTLQRGNFSRIISAPESFLAVARSMVDTRAPEATPKPKDRLTEDTSIPPNRASISAATTPSSTDQSKGPRATQQRSASLAPARAPSITAPTKQSTTGQSKGQSDILYDFASPTPAKGSASAGQDLSSGSMSLDSFDETEEYIKKGHKSSKNSQEPAAVGKPSTPVPCLDRGDAILVDVSCVTPRKSGLEVGMSPALEELKGLEFTQLTQLQDSQTSTLPSANRRLDFGVSSDKEQKPNKWDDTEGIISPTDEEFAEYQREIDIICELMEQTTLSDTFLTKLTECKDELEARLRLRGQYAEQRQKVPTPQEPAPKEAERFAAAALADTPKKGYRTSSRPWTDTPNSQIRLNAAAPQFYPKVFKQCRSVSNSTSTDSAVSSQSTPTQTILRPHSEGAPSVQTKFEKPSQPRSKSISTGPTTSSPPRSNHGHIFGDHLLPGARTRNLGQNHIFGDHLLPGRHIDQLPVPKPTISSTAGSPLFVAPKPTPVTFSSPPQPPKVISAEASVSNKTNSPNRSSVTMNAPQPEPAMKALSHKPTNTPTSTGAAKDTRRITPAKNPMSESIHAPTPKSDPSSGTQKKPSFSQSLMTSRPLENETSVISVFSFPPCLILSFSCIFLSFFFFYLCLCPDPH